MKKFTDAELDALPERGGICDQIEARTNPETGLTEMYRRPVRFFINDTDIYSFTDIRSGVVYTIGKDEDGYFKSRVF